MAETERRKFKTDRIRQQIFIGYGKKYAVNELELLAVVWGLEHFRLYIYGKPIELLTDHQALESFIKRNRSNKTYSARLTRWLDRLAHFDIQIKHVAGKHLKLTDYLSRNPISKPEPIENYDEEYVINCIIPLLEFMNNYGSITDERETTTRTNQMNLHKANNQSNPRYVLKLQTNNNQQQNRSSLLPQQNSVYTHRYKDKQTRTNKMDLKIVEAIEKEDPSEETLKLKCRWKEKPKPGDYRYTQGQWKRYHPPRTLKAEQKKSKSNFGKKTSSCSEEWKE